MLCSDSHACSQRCRLRWWTAKQLELVLNVNNPDNAAASEEKFVALAHALIGRAFDGVEMGDIINRVFADGNACTVENGRSIDLMRQDWQGGIKGGYEKKFIIEQIVA